MNEQELQTQVAVLIADLMALRNICTLGVEDDDLTNQDLKNIFNNIKDRINQSLRHVDSQATIMVTQLYDMKRIIRQLIKNNTDVELVQQAKKLIG